VREAIELLAQQEVERHGEVRCWRSAVTITPTVRSRGPHSILLREKIGEGTARKNITN
jgi:hypothetical protein